MGHTLFFRFAQKKPPAAAVVILGAPVGEHHGNQPLIDAALCAALLGVVSESESDHFSG